MKIVLVQCGPRHEFFLVSSMLIGLQKAHPSAEIIWVGDSAFASIIRYNKRVSRYLDIDREFDFQTLSWLYGTDICINPCLSKTAREFCSKIHAHETLGFSKDKICGPKSEFAKRVFLGELTTNKHVLDIYYNIAGLKWSGEGYGLTYYPKTKQTKKAGLCFDNSPLPGTEDSESFIVSGDILRQMDTINAYQSVLTDNLFIAHASIALRKQTFFYTKPLSYRIEFFGNGKVMPL
jgi:hypothetical protein